MGSYSQTKVLSSSVRISQTAVKAVELPSSNIFSRSRLIQVGKFSHSIDIYIAQTFLVLGIARCCLQGDYNIKFLSDSKDK